jgi:hypothetical protein
MLRNDLPPTPPLEQRGTHSYSAQEATENKIMGIMLTLVHITCLGLNNKDAMYLV